MRRLLHSLEESEIIIVPTKKNNSFRSMRKYKTVVEEYFRQSAREIERGKVAEIFENAKVLVDAI